LRSIAAITVPESSTLRVTPFDKGALKDIERALNNANLGINPTNDGEGIRLNFPPMTEDRRKELAKSIAKASGGLFLP
jgi:ribosome recycling factor